MGEARDMLPAEVSYTDDLYDVFENADAVILLTEWNVYRGLDLGKLKPRMKTPVLVDLRNVYERDALERLGFEYHCIGR